MLSLTEAIVFGGVSVQPARLVAVRFKQAGMQLPPFAVWSRGWEFFERRWDDSVVLASFRSAARASGAMDGGHLGGP